MSDRDNAADRRLGERWERNFGVLAGRYGRCFTPHQIGRPDESASAYSYSAGQWNRLLLPDVTIWSSPGEHHEIKHKAATRHGTYGLERYRLEPLVSFARESDQTVYYTIHDHELAGGREVTENRIGHWRSANVLALTQQVKIEGRGHPTYKAGVLIDGEPICYWPVSLFVPLAELWTEAVAA